LRGEGEARRADIGAKAAADAVEAFASFVGTKLGADGERFGAGLGVFGEVEEIDGVESGGADVEAPAAGEAGGGGFGLGAIADRDGFGVGFDAGDGGIDFFAGEEAIEDDLFVEEGDAEAFAEEGEGFADLGEDEAGVGALLRGGEDLDGALSEMLAGAEIAAEDPAGDGIENHAVDANGGAADGEAFGEEGPEEDSGVGLGVAVEEARDGVAAVAVGTAPEAAEAPVVAVDDDHDALGADDFLDGVEAGEDVVDGDVRERGGKSEFRLGGKEVEDEGAHAAGGEFLKLFGNGREDGAGFGKGDCFEEGEEVGDGGGGVVVYGGGFGVDDIRNSGVDGWRGGFEFGWRPAGGAEVEAAFHGLALGEPSEHERHCRRGTRKDEAARRGWRGDF